MLRNKTKKLSTISLTLISLLALVGCDKDKVRLPKNYEEKIFDISKLNLNEDEQPVGYDYKQYYEALGSASDMYSKMLNKILLAVAKKAHLNDDLKIQNQPVYDFGQIDHPYTSVSDNYSTIKNDNVADKNVDARSKKAMADVAKGGSYSKENLFIEQKYAQYLKESYNYLNENTGVNKDYYINLNPGSETYNKLKVGKFVMPYYEYKDIFGQSPIEKSYQYYRTKETDDDYKINYLTTEYIYNKSYPSIGNSNARKVQIVSLTDRSDDPGAAKRLLNAYIDEYVKKGVKDDGFRILQRLWKGITSDAVTKINVAGRYDSAIILSSEEEQFLKDHNLMTDSDASTLTGKILKDKEKLDKGYDNQNDDYYDADFTLESEYTGSGAYSYEKGLRKSLDEIASKNLLTDGIYIQKDGISGIPDKLKDRVFSPKITNDQKKIENMKKDENLGKKTDDITLYQPDGYRYLTISDTLSGTNDEIIFYDADSKTYYLTRILDVVDTSALSKTNTSSIYNKEAGMKEQIAREVAYSLSTTGNYKNDSIVYWLSRVTFKYYDEDFLNYIKDNYKDVFKKDNPYKDEEKIALTDEDFADL